MRAAIGAVAESSETTANWALGPIGSNLSTQGPSGMVIASSVMFCEESAIRYRIGEIRAGNDPGGLGY